MRCAVVLCTYNGERFLPAQLESLRAQSRQPDVYVLSDDASSDGTWGLLQGFAADRRAAGAEVVLHRNPQNVGYVRHFEAALQRADAEVLFPCDQDDVWHPGKIARMLDVFRARPRLLVLHGDARLVDGEGRPIGSDLLATLDVAPRELVAMHAGRAFEVLLRRNIVTGAAMALRRELLPLALPAAEGWSHDEWLAIIASMHGEVDTMPEPVIDYRQHGGNQIGVRRRQGLERAGVGVGRSAFIQRAFLRAEGLAAHVSRDDGLASHRPQVEARLRHARARATLPAGWLQRTSVVLGEWLSGRYARYGNGLRSLAADLLGVD